MKEIHTASKVSLEQRRLNHTTTERIDQCYSFYRKSDEFLNDIQNGRYRNERILLIVSSSFAEEILSINKNDSTCFYYILCLIIINIFTWKQVIQIFSREYTADEAIWWYTKESFVYRSVNRVFRIDDITLFGIYPDII